MREITLDTIEGKDLLKLDPFIGLVPLACRKITARIPHQSGLSACQLLPGRSHIAPHSGAVAPKGRQFRFQQSSKRKSEYPVGRGGWITASGGYLFTKSLIFVFILVIGCSKPGIMIVSRKAAEAVSRFLSCDKADRKSSFLPLFFQTPFARDPAAKSSGIFLFTVGKGSLRSDPGMRGCCPGKSRAFRRPGPPVFHRWI